MSMITFKGIKSSYQRVKRMLSNPGDIPPAEEPAKKKPEILHLGLQNREVTETAEEPTGLDPFYDEINMSDHEDYACDQGDLYSKLDRDSKGEGEDEFEYSYALLDRRYSASNQKKKLPPVTPRPKVQVTSQYELIDRNNSSAASAADSEDESYSVLHRIPIPQKEENEEESYSYGHYDDITEFQGRMFLAKTEEPIKRRQNNAISPRNNNQIGAPPSSSKKISPDEKRKSVHLELLAKMQDKNPTQPPKIKPLNKRYSSNLELLVNQRRPSQQDALTAAVKKRFSTHLESLEHEHDEDLPIYAVANNLPQKKQLEKTYSTNLQLNSLSLNLSQRPALKPSESVGKKAEGFVAEDDRNLQDWEGEDEVEDLYEIPDELTKKRGESQKTEGIGVEDEDGEIYSIPYITR